MDMDGEEIDVLKINRANPDIPVTMAEIFSTRVFLPGSPAEDAKSYASEKALSSEVEAFYYGAFRFWKVIEQDVLKKGRAKPIGVLLVRNDLFEHAFKAKVYSFAATKQRGPVVKPIHQQKEGRDTFDVGLIPNAHEFLTKVLSRLGT
jgi:hypothetical protein